MDAAEVEPLCEAEGRDGLKERHAAAPTGLVGVVSRLNGAQKGLAAAVGLLVSVALVWSLRPSQGTVVQGTVVQQHGQHRASGASGSGGSPFGYFVGNGGPAATTREPWGEAMDLGEAAKQGTEDVPWLGFVKDRLADPETKRDVCVVGAGMTGTVIAERYATVLGKSVLVLDKRPHIGGNAFDFEDPDTGVRVGRYGAHVLHTSSPRVWMYLNLHDSAPRWLPWHGETAVEVDDSLKVSYPVGVPWVDVFSNRSVHTLAELRDFFAAVREPCHKTEGCATSADYMRSMVGSEMYQKFFFPYFVKKFDKEPTEVPAGTSKFNLHSVLENPKPFVAKHAVLPEHGFTRWFAAMLDHPRIETVVNTDFADHKEALLASCGQVVYTGPVDAYFADRGLPRLDYRTAIFRAARLRDGPVQDTAILENPDWEVDYLRSVDMRLFHGVASGTGPSVCVKEVPSPLLAPEDQLGPDGGEPFWAVPTTRNSALYEKYAALAEAEEKVTFVGLGTYRNFNLAEAVENGLNAFFDLAGRPAVPDMPDMFEVQRLDWMHVPKTGTSFIYTLVLYKCDEKISQAADPAKEHRKIYNAVAHSRPTPPCAEGMKHGHHPLMAGPRGFYKKEASLKNVATMIRDPMVRIASGFTHSYHDCTKMAKGRFKTRPKDVCAVLEDENAAPEDVERMEKIVLEYANCVMGCQTRMITGEKCAHDTPYTEADADKLRAKTAEAIDKMSQFAFVGLTDRWHQSLCAFSKRFPRPSGSSYAFEVLSTNTRPTRHGSCNPIVSNILRKHNFTDPMDGPLFETARQSFEQSIGSCAHSFQKP